jgi:polysaccharide export outer membrane protein
MTGCRLRKAGRGRGRDVAIVAGAMLGLLALVGCGGTGAYAPRSEFIVFSPEQKTEIATQAANEYRIQEGDVLKVYFAYERNLNQDFVHVLSDGSVNLVGVDRIELAGLTMAQADSVLTFAYSREYREPALSVMIQETRGRRVYVLGEVSDPGSYVVPTEGMDVMSAIAMASGFTENAARDGTLIVRVTKEGYEFREINLKEFGTAQFAASAVVQLQSLDIVYVPRSRVGDFGYFAKTVLAGISYVTRVAYDVFNIANGTTGRY